LGKQPGRDKPVTTVVSWPSYDDDLGSERVARPECGCDRPACPLHELDSGYTAGNREPIG